MFELLKVFIYFRGVDRPCRWIVRFYYFKEGRKEGDEDIFLLKLYLGFNTAIQ